MKMVYQGNDIADFVYSVIKTYDDAKKYNLLVELLEDSTFTNHVIYDLETYGSLTRSFEYWNELFFLLSKGQYRYSSFKSWNNVHNRKIGKLKKISNK